MEYYFIPVAKFTEWLASLLSEFLVYIPVTEKNKQHFRLLTSEYLSALKKSPSSLSSPIKGEEPDLGDPIRDALTKIRPAESLKGFFFLPREVVSKGFIGEPSNVNYLNPSIGGSKQRIIIGAKNCDLMPLLVHKKMFLEGKFVDPFYQDRLLNTTIISADCPIPETTCFCSLLGINPYPSDGQASDINLTVLTDGYLLEPFTEKGKALIERRADSGERIAIRPARDEEIKEREEQRDKARRTLEAINPKPLTTDLAQAVEQMKDDAFWQEHAKTCIECFGCLVVCPTCFCYLLYDQAENPAFTRTKIWDACYYPAYARVGGGMNPRAEFLARFKNRFHCKFMNFFRDYNFYACSGCGRCLSVCSGKIDIRKILSALWVWIWNKFQIPIIRIYE